MADHSLIEWTDATWNPITGCSVVSPGCTNCYAMKLAGTRLMHHPSREGLTRDSKAGPVWTGEVRLNDQWLDQPLRWKKPRKIFVCAHGDLFAESVPDEWVDKVFAIMALAPQHTFQVLTKRAGRMQEYLSTSATRRRVYDLVCDLVMSAGLQVVLIADPSQEPFAPRGPRVHLGIWPLVNVWLGVSAEDQTRAEERIPLLLDTPAAIRWISAEPLLGALDLTCIHQPNGGFGPYWINALDAGQLGWFHDEAATQPTEVDPLAFSDLPRLDWVIVGGESGPGARPMELDWAKSLRDQCAAAAVPFFFKQWGSHLPAGQMQADGRPWSPSCGSALHATKAVTGRLLDGAEHNAMPAIEARP